MILDEFISILGFEVKGERDAKRYDDTLNRLRGTMRRVGDRALQSARHFALFAAGIADASRAAAKGVTRIGVASGAVVAAASKAATSFARSIVTAGSSQESQLGQLKVALKGSADAAQVEYGRIQKFAGETIVDQEKLIDAFIKIKTTGVDPWAGSMQALADTMAATGGDQVKFQRITKALTDTFGIGRINASNMNQFIEAGVPIWKLLADKMGKTVAEVRKLSEEGKLGADAVQLLTEALGDNFKGASKAAAETAAGIKNNLGDLKEQFLQNVGGLGKGGFFDVYKGTLVELDATIRGFLAGPAGQDFVKGLSDALSRGAQAIQDFLKSLNPEDIQQIAETLVSVLNNVVDAFVRFMSEVKADDVASAITSIGSAFKVAYDVFTAVVDIVLRVKDAVTSLVGEENAAKALAALLIAFTFGFSNIASVITGVTAAIPALLKAIVALTGASGFGAVIGVFTRLLPVIALVYAAFKGLWAAWETFKETGSILAALSSFSTVFTETVINGLKDVVKWVLRLPAMLIDAITGSNLDAQVADFFNATFSWENVASNFSTWLEELRFWVDWVGILFVSAVDDWMATFKQWFLDLGAAITTTLASWLATYVAWIASVLSTLVGGTDGWLSVFVTWMDNTWNAVTGKLDALGEFISNWVAAQIAKIQSFFSTKFSAITDKVKSVAQGARERTKGIGSKIANAGRAVGNFLGGNDKKSNGAALASVAGGTSQTINNTTNRAGATFHVTNNVKQTVTGRTAPEAAAKAVGKGVQRAANRRSVQENREAGG